MCVENGKNFLRDCPEMRDPIFTINFALSGSLLSLVFYFFFSKMYVSSFES